MNQAIYERLKELAKESQLATPYSVIAPLADLDMSLEHDRTEIGRILGEISTYEHNEERPLLSAIVVHQTDGRPGKGFFTLARELKLLRPDEDEDVFWQNEVKRVHEYWQGQQEGL